MDKIEKTETLPQKKQESVFINGRSQIIEMLQIMPQQEKTKLLKNIRLRNPAMAQELSEQSLSFGSLEGLGDRDLGLVLEHVNPTVLGVALKRCTKEFQRRALSLIERQNAETAFSALTTILTDENWNIKRAQSRILQLVIDLYRQKRLSLI